jgi:hypothetical protein
MRGSSRRRIQITVQNAPNFNAIRKVLHRQELHPDGLHPDGPDGQKQEKREEDGKRPAEA